MNDLLVNLDESGNPKALLVARYTTGEGENLREMGIVDKLREKLWNLVGKKFFFQSGFSIVKGYKMKAVQQKLSS